MIAIIDSGSTKADWIFTNGQITNALTTVGINPNFVNEEEAIRIINDGIIKYIPAQEVKKIYFFGSGCSSVEQKKIISNALTKLFQNAKVTVEHDIAGAVLATCGNEEGIACIIGTGSNSVYFDGNRIHENNYGLGFILADEGAGTYLGKKLITQHLYNLLPSQLSNAFTEKYKLSRNDVITKVYNNPTANAWLGSFAQFFEIHKEEPWIKSTIKNGFKEFVDLYVKNYPRYKEVPVHFVGSIAFLNNKLLDEVAAENNFKIGKIIQKPIEGLTDYYSRQNF